MRSTFLKKALCLFCILPMLFLSSQLRYTAGQTFSFQTDVQKVMKIIINSLYKTKEIFLRELISNASDALEKLRIASLKDGSMLGSDTHLNITIRYNKTEKLLVISDSGIGMSKDDFIKNLGTIAKSGTSDFLAALEKQNDTSPSNLIGQFGVGFYSSFLVADRVSVISRPSLADEAYEWSSTADNDFTITKVNEPVGRGTQIYLHMKEDAMHFLDETTLKNLIQKYSEFTTFDIFLWTEKTIEVDPEPEPESETKETSTETEKKEEEKEEKEKDAKEKDEVKEKEDEDAKDKTEDEDEDEVKVESEKEEGTTKEEDKTPKKIQKTVYEWEKININKPIWLRNPNEVDQEQYNAFYKSFFKDYRDPLAHVMYKGEGDVEFRMLFYIPKKPESDIYQVTPEHYAHNMKLFVRRVFITDELLNFLPKFLNFIKGLIDSDDFPLNVSRETIQSSPVLEKIKRMLVSKAISKIKDMAKNETEYLAFYSNFGTNLKFGILEDNKHKNTLASLLRFKSSFSETNLTSLDGYISRMHANQSHIYYITASTVDQAKKSPYLEALIGRGYEVLYLVDGIDEYITSALPSYLGHSLQNVGKGKLEFGDENEEDKKTFEELEVLFQPLATHLQDHFKDHVDKVKVSNRLTTSSCALIASDMGWTGRMHHIMMAQKDLANPAYHYYANQKKTLEINPYHPIIKRLLQLVNDNKVDKDVNSLVQSLFDMAWIKGEFPIKDTDAITKRMEHAIRIGLDVDLKEEAEVKLKPAPEKVKEKENEKETSEDKMESNEEPMDGKASETSTSTESSTDNNDANTDAVRDEL